MAEFEVILPKMGESVAEATITSWLKNVGDSIESEESLVEIATDKVDSEVPSPEDGILTKILVEEGEVAQVGQTIAIISSEAGGDTTTTSSTTVAEVDNRIADQPSIQESNIETSNTIHSTETNENYSDASRFYSPLVKNIAKKEGIPIAELESVTGSGQGGRVTKKDILAHVANRAATTTSSKETESPAKTVKQTASPKTQASPASPIDHGENVEIIEMDRMRKLIATHMVNSKQTSPHVTSFVEADVTNLVNWRNKMKGEFLKREGEKLTFTPIFIEAIVKAIKDFPMINVSLEGDNIIRKKFINIGMATALPSGNLIVPVIKNADNLNLTGISKAVNDLASRARNNQLKPDEISGGTYTVSNVGSFGNVMGTPIINQPQVAIMAVGSIIKKPAVIETEFGDVIAIRHKMFLSHSYDHRVVDGALGGMFVRKVADYLEEFDVNREI